MEKKKILQKIRFKGKTTNIMLEIKDLEICQKTEKVQPHPRNPKTKEKQN